MTWLTETARRHQVIDNSDERLDDAISQVNTRAVERGLQTALNVRLRRTNRLYSNYKQASCRRQTARYFMFRVILSHSRSLKLVHHSKAWTDGFSFAFHSNYGSILYHFRDKRDIGRKIAIFHTPAFDAPVGGGSPSEYCHTVWYRKQEVKVI